MNKRIVIIGGMGPQASISLHQRLIQRAAELGANDGDQFPEIVHLSLPIKDFISEPAAMPAALEQILAAVRRLYLWRRYASSHSLQHGASAPSGATAAAGPVICVTH